MNHQRLLSIWSWNNGMRCPFNYTLHTWFVCLLSKIIPRLITSRCFHCSIWYKAWGLTKPVPWLKQRIHVHQSSASVTVCKRNPPDTGWSPTKRAIDVESASMSRRLRGFAWSAQIQIDLLLGLNVWDSVTSCAGNMQTLWYHNIARLCCAVRCFGYVILPSEFILFLCVYLHGFFTDHQCNHTALFNNKLLNLQHFIYWNQQYTNRHIYIQTHTHT